MLKCTVNLLLFVAEVAADIDKSHAEGFHSIPVFVFKSGEREWVVHGAVETDEFEEVLTEIVAGLGQ
jgi:predicted DsbA family dithiol-disulfide isomerase